MYYRNYNSVPKKIRVSFFRRVSFFCARACMQGVHETRTEESIALALSQLDFSLQDKTLGTTYQGEEVYVCDAYFNQNLSSTLSISQVRFATVGGLERRYPSHRECWWPSPSTAASWGSPTFTIFLM